MSKPITYSGAGVDLERGAEIVRRIVPMARETHRPGVLGGIGGFGGLFEAPCSGYRQPVLVAGTDGVGTKLRLCSEAGRMAAPGVDLVAMCVNDLLAMGAEPLFFLDYCAANRLDPERLEPLLEGIVRGCREAGAALLGGETAELPNTYVDDGLELVGFCVGVAEKDRLLDGKGIEAGDLLLGVGSSGPHSNGYSLVRRIVDMAGGLGTLSGSLIDQLCEPTRIYIRSVLPLAQSGRLKAIAHITGGGLPENVERIIPDDLAARIDTGAWPWPPVFDWLSREGPVERGEMLRTFNCGIGLVLAVSPQEAAAVREDLARAGEDVFEIGRVETGSGVTLD
ncbi:MAG: phosphoribosylformylglycinamidine cyclo-ligase [Gammaproteobacteria bacterium]|nr:phosphoribosylformylglycinamidine cyclo-ligase [Gammaproteobacteria bacterium]